MSGNLLLRSVRLTNGEIADIAIRDGLVAAIGAGLTGDNVIEGRGLAQQQRRADIAGLYR